MPTIRSVVCNEDDIISHMLVIGHRGAAGLAPENTLEGLQAGIDAGADILEFDVRTTKDNVLVLVHDFHTLRTHHRASIISRMTFDELQSISDNRPKVTRLDDVLDKYFGSILLNIEIKSRGGGEHLVRLLKKRYIKKAADWDDVLISSFKGYELVRIRRLTKRANLSLLHTQNPFIFVAYHRFINLTAVGFHRLYLNRFAIEIAKKAGLFIYTYTVDRTGALSHIAAQGIEGVVTNYPDKIIQGTEELSKRREA